MSDAPKTMDARTEQALRESIAKWEKNAAVAKCKDAKVNSADCPLCELFAYENCRECPVKNHTGKSECYGTPYYKAREHYYDNQLAAFREAAQREVDFLKSLLPEAGE